MSAFWVNEGRPRISENFRPQKTFKNPYVIISMNENLLEFINP